MSNDYRIIHRHGTVNERCLTTLLLPLHFITILMATDFNRYAYDDFIARLIREGFIKMEKLP